MSFEKRLFKIVGNRLKIESNNHGTSIVWKRLSILDVFLWTIVAMTCVWGFGYGYGWDELWNVPYKPLAPSTLIVIGSLWGLLLLHLLFNRTSRIDIVGNEIRLKKRQITGVLHTFSKKDISFIETKLNSKNYENDTGFYPDIYSLYFHINTSKRIKLDSFNEEDCSKIKNCFN